MQVTGHLPGGPTVSAWLASDHARLQPKHIYEWHTPGEDLANTKALLKHVLLHRGVFYTAPYSSEAEYIPYAQNLCWMLHWSVSYTSALCKHHSSILFWSWVYILCTEPKLHSWLAWSQFLPVTPIKAQLQDSTHSPHRGTPRMLSSGDGQAEPLALQDTYYTRLLYQFQEA